MTRKSIERELRSSFTKTIKGDQIIETANHLQKSPDSSVDIEMDQDILMVDHGSEKMNDSGQANGKFRMREIPSPFQPHSNFPI